jgi:hypothetical protein
MPGFMEQDEEITAKFKTTDTFRQAVSQRLVKEMYGKIRKENTHNGL